MSEVTVARLIADLRSFLLLAAVVGVVTVATSWGGAPGAVRAWTTVLVLWALGASWAAVLHWRRAYPRTGDLLGLLGVQNVAIQLLVVLPITLTGVARLLRMSPADGGVAFVANAVATVVVLPLLAAVVMTFAALVLAMPLRALLGSWR